MNLLRFVVRPPNSVTEVGLSLYMCLYIDLWYVIRQVLGFHESQLTCSPFLVHHC